MPDLGDLYRVLCGSSSVVLNVELLHQFIKPAKKFVLLGTEITILQSFH